MSLAWAGRELRSLQTPKLCTTHPTPSPPSPFHITSSENQSIKRALIYYLSPLKPIKTATYDRHAIDVCQRRLRSSQNCSFKIKVFFVKKKKKVRRGGLGTVEARCSTQGGTVTEALLGNKSCWVKTGPPSPPNANRDHLSNGLSSNSKTQGLCLIQWTVRLIMDCVDQKQQQNNKKKTNLCQKNDIGKQRQNAERREEVVCLLRPRGERGKKI